MPGKLGHARLVRWVVAPAVLAGLLVPATMVQASIQELQAMQVELERIQREKEEAKNQLAHAYYEAAEAEALLRQAEAELAEANGRLSYVQGLLDEATDNVQQADEAVAEAEERVAQRQVMLARRMRSVNEQGASNYLSLLFGADSFVDFFSRLDMLKLVMKQDAHIFARVREEKAELNEKREAAVYQRQQLARLADEERENRNHVAFQRDEAAQISRSLESRKRNLEGMLARFDQQEERTREQVAEIQERMRREAGRFAPIYPVGTVRITDSFGGRMHPILGTWRQHNGTDFAANHGDPVYAIEDGVVIVSRWDDAYGYLIVVDHGGGVSSWYAHSSRILVSIGQSVTRGERIALAGSTGWSTGPHVHLEIHMNGKPVNPMEYIQ